jgi:hypothetical protein
MNLLRTLATLAFAAAAWAQTFPENPGFEEILPGPRPSGWSFSASGAAYTVSSVPEARTGRYAALVQSPNGANPSTYGLLTQSVPPAPYRGKAVRFRGAARGQYVRGYAGLYLSITTPGGQTAFFDDMEDRSAGADWREYTILAQVPENAETISAGFIVTGLARGWFDDASFEIAEGLPQEPARTLEAQPWRT